MEKETEDPGSTVEDLVLATTLIHALILIPHPPPTAPAVYNSKDVHLAAAGNDNDYNDNHAVLGLALQ